MNQDLAAGDVRPPRPDFTRPGPYPASPAPGPSLRLVLARRTPLGGGSDSRPGTPEEPPRPSHECVRRMIEAGQLPKASETSIWGGPSTGRPCDVCGQVIAPDDYEYEISRAGGGTARLHLRCLVVWLEAQGGP